MADSDELFIDQNSYEHIWNVLIQPTIMDYSNYFADIIVSDDAKQSIWNEYREFNSQCKKKYMQDTTGKLDRHKVCACYMYAIIKADTIKCKLATSDTEQKYLSLNENLAITVGMSLLRAFIMTSIDSNETMSQQEKEVLKSRVDAGIVFPDCNHGIYRENFVSELYYTKREKIYNILSLANTLFLLETHTLETEAVHKHSNKEKQSKGNKKHRQF